MPDESAEPDMRNVYYSGPAGATRTRSTPSSCAILPPDMLSARRRCAVPLACLLALSTVSPGSARAETPKTGAGPDAAAAAHQHASHARELYQQGAYHEAITELEAALKLDPTGKDLVFNLGVVHEKLGDIEDALRYFLRYEQMDLDPQERAKADTYLKRLQGARKEVERPQQEPSPPPPPPPPAPPPPPEKRYGRFDWITASAAVIGVGGLTVGSIFGVRALGNRPKAGAATTDSDGYAEVEAAQLTAHNEAVVSDVSFAVGAAGLAATAILFFSRARYSTSRQTGSAGSGASPVVISCAPRRGGGALLIGAQF